MHKRIGRAGLTYAEAVAIQDRLRTRVTRTRTFGRVRTVAGVDVSVKNDRACAAFVVMTWPKLEVVETATADQPVAFPYIPGLLSFREMPVLEAAFSRLATRPDLLMVDGQGFAHPRRIGLACHLGVTLDLPSIGCGKTRLVGEHRDPRDVRGARAVLRHEGETIGCVLRTRAGVKPLYISIGHRIDLDTAVRYVLRAAPRFRLPEPQRAAHRAAGATL